MTITFLAPDGVAATAQQERQAKAAQHGGGSGRPLGGRSGFRVDTPSNILTATSTTWTLTPCSAEIDPGASTHQGMYGWATDANVTGSVTAADATYARKDIVYTQINDSSAGDGSGELTANVKYAAGTPSASPVAPALGVSGRERSFLVGTITMPQVGGGSPTVVLNPARFVAAGGILPVGSAADRATIAAPYLGMEIQRLDLTQVSASGVRERWNGTNWDHFGHAEFTSATNIAPQNTAWGLGVLSIDTAKTTDTAFITINGGADKVQVRDAGLYEITASVAFTAAISGVCWISPGPSDYVAPMGGGLVTAGVSIANVRLAAGALIQPSLAHGSGASPGGDRTFTGRLRVTRIA